MSWWNVVKNGMCWIPHIYDMRCVLIGCHHVTIPDGWHEAATVDLTETLTCDGQTDKCSWQQWKLSVGGTVAEICETPETVSRVISASNTRVTAYCSSGQDVDWTVRQFREFAEGDSAGLTEKMSLPSFVPPPPPPPLLLLLILILLLLRVPCPRHLYGIYCSKSTDISLNLWRNLNRIFAYVTLDVLMKYIHCSHVLKPSGYYMYRQFNIQHFYLVSTQCFYVFCVDLRTNSDYFPIQR